MAPSEINTHPGYAVERILVTGRTNPVMRNTITTKCFFPDFRIPGHLGQGKLELEKKKKKPLGDHCSWF